MGAVQGREIGQPGRGRELLGGAEVDEHGVHELGVRVGLRGARRAVRGVRSVVVVTAGNRERSGAEDQRRASGDEAGTGGHAADPIQMRASRYR